MTEPTGDTRLQELTATRRTLLEATDRDEGVDAVLQFAAERFAYAAAFALVSGELVGHDAIGPYSRAAHRAAVRRVRIRPPRRSIFRAVLDTGGPYLGPGSASAYDRVVLADLGREEAGGKLLLPVRVQGRIVLVLFVDAGGGPVPTEAASELLALVAALPALFEAIIRRRKQGAERPIDLVRKISKGAAEEPLWPEPLARPLPEPVEVQPDPVEVHEVAAADPSPPTAPPATATPATATTPAASPPAATTPAASPPAATTPAETTPAATPPTAPTPADLVALLQNLRTPAPEVLVALASHGVAGARALAPAFPGSGGRPVMNVAEMDPDPGAHGPVVAAMAFLGPVALPVLLDLAASESPEARLYALFLIGLCPGPDALPRLLERVSDLDPRVATAARAALAAHRSWPGFGEALAELRGELSRGDDPIRLCDVLRTLAYLADGASVPHIIDLLKHRDREVAREAQDTLEAITLQSLGGRRWRWRRWYRAHGEEARPVWLVAGLSHRRVEVREAAIAELSRMTDGTLGFEPSDPPAVRRLAVQRWAEWLAEEARAGRL